MEISDGLKRSYPGAVIGLLVMKDVRNPAHHDGLERLTSEMESRLRVRFAAAGKDALKAEPIVAVYAPPGIGEQRVRVHLEDIRRLATMISHPMR